MVGDHSTRRTRAAARIVLAIGLCSAVPAPFAFAQMLTVDGAVPKPLTLTQPEFAGMARTTVTLTAHGQTRECSGVDLLAILGRAGVFLGDASKGPDLHTVLLMTARDRYQVVLSLGELDPSLTRTKAVVADTCNGQRLDPRDGPLHLLLPGDLKAARSVRQLERVTVVVVNGGSPAPPASAPGTPAPAGHEHAMGQAAPDHLEHRFDDPAAASKAFDDPARDAWQMPSRVIDALAIGSGQSVADIGAGTGYFTARLAKLPAAPRVFAVDIEPSMIEHLKQRAAKEGLSTVVPVLADAKSPNLPEPVDVVLVVDTYHHIGDRVRYFRDLRAKLKPRGRLAIIDWKKGGPMGPTDEFRYEPERFESELREAGYRLLARHDFLPNQLFLVFEAAGK